MLSPETIQVLGILGNILLVLAYYPQIHKILKTRKTEDISILMWITYCTGDLLLLIYAAARGDTVFTMLFTLFIVGNVILIVLTKKYSGKKPEENKKQKLAEPHAFAFGKKEEASKEEMEESEYRDIPHHHEKT